MHVLSSSAPLFLALLLPVATADPLTIVVGTDEAYCVESICTLDTINERGDGRLVLTLDVRTERIVDDVTACASHPPCAEPEGYVVATIEMWRDSNACDGIQTQAGPCGAPDEVLLATTLTLP